MSRKGSLSSVVPREWDPRPSPRLAYAHAVPHRVVSQILRPEAADFQPPDTVLLQSPFDAHLCVSALTLKDGRDVSVPLVSVAAALPHVTSLSLSDWKVNAQLLAEVVDALPRLAILRCFQCRCVDARALASVGRLLHLEVLALPHCGGIDGQALQHVQRLPKLRVLDVSNCTRLESWSPVDLDRGAFRALEHLDVSNGNQPPFGRFAADAALTPNPGTSGTAGLGVGLGARTRVFGNLRVLTLYNCSDVDDSTLRCVACIDKLEVLDLSNCDGINGGLVYLRDMHRLKRLDLRRCRDVDGDGLQHLSELPQLHTLYLNDCHGIDALALHHIGLIPRLRSLHLYGCEKVDKAGLHHVSHVPSVFC